MILIILSDFAFHPRIVAIDLEQFCAKRPYISYFTPFKGVDMKRMPQRNFAVCVIVDVQFSP